MTYVHDEDLYEISETDRWIVEVQDSDGQWKEITWPEVIYSEDKAREYAASAKRVKPDFAYRLTFLRVTVQAKNFYEF